MAATRGPAIVGDRRARTYTNPIARGTFMGDPFVVRYGETYYLTGTTDPACGFRLWSSPNTVDWQPLGFAYRRADDAWGTDSFWAPELFGYAGTYYLVYSARRPEGGGTDPGFRVCLARSDRPEGPYRDIRTPWCDPGHPCIDGHVFVDADGTPYLYVADVGVREHPVRKLWARIRGVRLSPDLAGPDGVPVVCLEAEQPWETPADGRSLCNEGPFVFRRDGAYVMLYSANHYAEPFYGIGYATADAPLGPWRKSPDNPIVAQAPGAGISGPGHCCVIPSPDDTESFLVYHAHADPTHPGGKRTVNIDRLVFPDDRRIALAGPTRSPQPVPSGA